MTKFRATPALKSLCENDGENKSKELVINLKRYLHKKRWTPEDRQEILNRLSEALLDRQLRPVISRLFAPILRDLFARIQRPEVRDKLFVGLSELIGHYGCAKQFAYHCFQTYLFSPQQLLESNEDENSVLDILIASLSYLNFHPIWFRDAIDWSFLSQYFSHTNPDIRYIAIQCHLILFSLSDNQFQTLFGKLFADEEVTQLRVKYLHLFSPRRPIVETTDSLHYDLSELNSSDCGQCFEDTDFRDEVVCVMGVLLNKYKNSDSSQSNASTKQKNVVSVPTTQSNVRSIALAVSYGKPVLVEGPVGCGKTLLIEYIASLTARHKPPHLMKIQMGDQIDAKLLIGSHICTDIPGEFIWKAGPLTQAMKYGFWLLLEDIDCAPPDVLSMLSSVLEANSLSSLPGCENQLKRVHNDFRIFFTRRLMSAGSEGSSHSEFAVKSSLHYNCLNKLCYKICLDCFGKEELLTLIANKWQNLRPISERILDIYYYLQNESSQNMGLKRQVSLRDLMKWCQRVSKHFKLNSDESAINAFLDANDCFLQSLSDTALRLTKAEVIGSHLNINSSQSEYLSAKRKPEFLLNEESFKIGRTSIKSQETVSNPLEQKKCFYSFALTLQSLSLLERIAVAVDNNESVLLCGETGTGKTSCVQYLARRLNKSLTVVNMNQQSDSTDLLGGYKPVEMKSLMRPIRDEYLQLFQKTFESEKNTSFLKKFDEKYRSHDWVTLFKVMAHVYESALNKCKDPEVLERWQALGQRITRLEANQLNQKGCLAFSFIEGSLVKAMTSGHWILLDEINLAETETLQCLSAILDSDDGSVILLDKADGMPVKRSPDFRLFACMNPATDVGKKELPLGIRNRFTEFFVNELEDKSDLRILVHSYIGQYVSPKVVEKIVEFYLQIKSDAKTVLTDANGMRPLYSLRTLCRALWVSATNPCGIFQRSLYEAFCLSFLTRLDTNSRTKVENDIIETIFASKDNLSLLKAKLEAPKVPEKYVLIEGFYILKGSKDVKVNESYILTPTVQKNLKDICRIVSIGRTFPVLLEGETSVGKTSLIEWLAAATGNVCVRVNNHEHTDLQEYVGSYCADLNGKLVFKEGILAEAMRNGYWMILDELNLAPTEVLEALNRVLDDNRELFIAETQQLIKADPKFLLFATQNPAGHYGGRKLLSRAFRNRFIELHFNTIPSGELETILHQRCSLPMSYAKRMVGVLVDLQVRRRDSGVFAGKHGFITLRDLFRWGERYNKFAKQNDQTFYDWDLHLANDGYMLLAGRVRKPEEATLIMSVLETRFKRKLDANALFGDTSFLNTFGIIPQEFGHIVWNNCFRRLGKLVSEAIKYNEPVLLVGETGCGKTSICQLFAALNHKHLHSVNCHMNTESADFLGSLRPVRNFDNEMDGESVRPLFEWVDGPLVDAMKSGHFFLVDEISLADDSVLERLNSVLESERTLVVAENNNCFDNEISIPVIKAKESFRYLATMNPGGDYGKKELSPALRNRFTEIWCPPYDDISDIKQIIRHNLDQRLSQHKDIVCQTVCDFLQWFNESVCNSKRIVISIRDILSWLQFINICTEPDRVIPMSLSDAFTNGALLVFVDAIGTGSSFNIDKSGLRSQCHQNLQQLAKRLHISDRQYLDISLDDSKYFSIEPFYLTKGPQTLTTTDSLYEWKSPTVQTNVLRVLRALNLPKPILLEGMPGVGKTTLVQALATASGHRLIRINLSEQTDISDLFGADLPVEGHNSAGKFSFRDGPLLQALKSDYTWIVLDELNLASQSVLEGLNACLDHRSEIFIPELNKTFNVSKANTRIFATQNPHSEGGARKGLPRSFLNRFTNVYMESFSTDDYVFILSHLFPNIRQSVIKQMVDFNNEVMHEIVLNRQFAQRGSPWEFNLRELIRWAQVVTHNVSDTEAFRPEKFVNFLYVNKMRTLEDRTKMRAICDKYFDCSINCDEIDIQITDSYLQIGHSFLKRRRSLSSELKNFNIFEAQKECLQSLVKCIEMNWLSILIGESGVGKTSAVQMLADLTGHKLTILAVNAEMDTMDLLGGFEQKDLSHKLTRLEESVFDLCAVTFQSLLIDDSIKRIMRLWFEIQVLSNSDQTSDDNCLERLRLLHQIVNHLSELNHLNIDIVGEMKHKINELKDNYRNASQFNGSFEWRDSILIRAITCGQWLLIDNANLCSAAVLDRLNPLLEPDGELTINEKGCIDGQLTAIRPHPDFRLILSMDPINGELSRAMRNRGIEINMSAIGSRKDFNRQLNSLIESDIISQFFIGFFDRHTDQNESINFSHFNKCVQSFIFQLQNGFDSQYTVNQFVTNFSKTSIDYELNLSIATNSSLKTNKTICLNNFKRDAITSCALHDSLLLDQIDNYKNNLLIDDWICQNSTALRIYLERSSLKDYSIREFLLKQLFTKGFESSSKLVKQIEESVGKVAQKAIERSILFEFPIDLRDSPNVWNLFSNLNKSLNIDVQLIENYINRYSVNMFWNQLMSYRNQVNQSDCDSDVSFYSIASDIINNKISRNSCPKVFVVIHDIINEINDKLIQRSLDLCPTNDDFMLLRDILLWFHQLLSVCEQKSTKRELLNQFIVDKFIVLWVLTNEKSLSILQSFLNVDISDSISSLNQMLKIDALECDQKKQKLIYSLNKNSLIVKNEESAQLFISYSKLIDDIYRSNQLMNWNALKDCLLLISQNITSIISGQYNREHIEKDISYIEQKLQNQIKSVIDCEDIVDLEVIERRESVASIQFQPLILFSFFYSEIDYLNHKTSDFIERYIKLIETKNLSLSPIHISCLILAKNIDHLSSDLILQHLLDYDRYMRIENLLTHLSYDYNHWQNDNVLNILDEKLLQMSSESIASISLISSHMLSDKHNSIGLLNSKISKLLSLRQFLTLNFCKISNLSDKSLSSLHFQLATNWFSSIVANLSMCSPVKKTSLTVKSDTLNDLINETSHLIQTPKDTFANSIVSIFVGLISSHLLCPTFSIDPIERNKCKLNHYLMDLKLINTEITARTLLSVIKSKDASVDKSSHPLIQELVRRKAKLEIKILKYESNLTYRSSAKEYFSMKADCNHFLNTVVDRKTIENFIKRLINSYRNEGPNDKTGQTLINELINLETSVSAFIAKIQSNYILYKDLTNLFLIGVSLLLKGFKSATLLLKQQKFVVNELKFNSVSDLNRDLEIVIDFCHTNSPSFVANYLCDSQTIAKFTQLSNISKTNFEANISSLMRSALLEIQNQMTLSFSDSLLNDSFKIFNAFVKCWQKLREAEETKRLEDEALFEFKTKAHESELSEEEMDRKMLEKTFPTYHNHYSQFITDMTPEDSQDIKLIEISSEKDITSDIIDIHYRIIDPITRNQENVPNFRKSYILRNSVINQILKSLAIFVDSTIDSQLIAGQLIATNEAIASIEANSCDQSFNIYHNSSLREINNCFKILESLERKIITDLLPQFENHPSLTKLLKIIKTILELDTKEPLIKLATGLEVVLQAAQDWQLIAHRGISLSEHLNQITQLVISWRKLELNYWSECLDSVNRKIEEKQRNKFWFHLYLTISSLVENKSIDDCNHEDLKEFVVSIKKFIEGSKLGEFKVRISLLRVFTYHVLCIREKPNTNYLFISLNNLYHFYNQFVANIETALTSVRKPIEKEVKEFVKIAKWSDRNFWSVKSAVDKSHRQLCRYIKKYESELNKPIDDYLVVNKSEMNACLSPHSRLKHDFDKQFRANIETIETTFEFSGYNYNLLNRSSVLLKKSNSLARKTLKNSRLLVKQINAIEDFASDVITGVTELSELQVPNDIKDKTKWKQIAHNIHNQKRRALSDFLKTLSTLGLSYRKGLVVSDDYDLNHIIITTGPLDHCSPQQTTLSQRITEDLNSCDKYFYKCLTRLASLRLLLETPNKELTIGTIDRIKGFSAILMKKVIEQRKSISQNIFAYNRFKSMESNLSRLVTCDLSFIISGKQFDKYLKSVEHIIVKTLSFNYRSIDLFDSLCPTAEEPLLLLTNSETQVSRVDTNGSKQVLHNHNEKLKSLCERVKIMRTFGQNHVFCDKDLLNLRDIYECLSSVVNDLNAFYSDRSLSDFGLNNKFKDILNENHILSTNLTNVFHIYTQISNNLSAKVNIEGDIRPIADYSTKLLKVVLSSIEKIYKLLEKREESEDVLKDSMNSIDLQNAFKDIDIERTLRLINKFVSLLAVDCDKQENCETLSSSLQTKVKLFKTILPFIGIYSKLYEYLLTISMSSLRTSNKLLHILLSLFCELTQNGFCLPPELSDESDDKDMATELKSIEDGGLGEGQGTKDVSDKIESEDQLEDAFKEGAEKTDDQNDDRDIEEEDNGIEMQNDFDGQTFSPSKADNEENDEKSDEEESDNELEDQMADVDDNSDVLDEKIWGSDNEDNDTDEPEDEDETGFAGKDSIDNKVVAKDENKDLEKDFDEKPEKEKEEDLEINENELQNDEYIDESVDPYKQNEPKEQPKQDFPENMVLDENEVNDENEENGDNPEEKDISGSDESDAEDMKSDVEELDIEDMDLSDKENDKREGDAEEDNNETDGDNLKSDLKEEEVAEENGGEEEKENKSNDPTAKERDNLLNNDIEGVAGSDTALNDPKEGNDVSAEEQKQTQSETNEEQHGISQSIAGENSKPSDGKQMISSVSANELDANEEKLRQNNKRDKSDRSLADNYDYNAKRQKVVDSESQSETKLNDINKEQKVNSELYRHVDNQMEANNEVIDIASNEEKLLQNEDIDKEVKTNIDFDDNDIEDMDTQENDSIEELKPIDGKIDNKKFDSKNRKDANKDKSNESAMDTDGQNVDTLSVQRGYDSTFHTAMDLVDHKDVAQKTIDFEKYFDEFLLKSNEQIDVNSVVEVWKQCLAKVSPLVYELCERLQLVLEPTKSSKMRGDYRTGKRLNMRKVIAYIASDFRKDKIWLRRTKPSKREYQIVIAIDDSSSMADNKSKQLAFESLALLGKSLSLLEAGELAVMSFGQTVRLLQAFDEPFTDQSGANLLTRLTFSQTETRIADLLQRATEMLSTCRRSGAHQSQDVSQLVIIVSDGRGIYSEGEAKVKQMIRTMKEMSIFTVFVVIDNPLSKDSILDIRVPLFDSSGSVRIESYMERFPFPFYILLRDIDGLPLVMGEALRQWFELITSAQT